MRTKRTLVTTIIILCLTGALLALFLPRTDQHNPSRHFSQDEQDSLMVKLVVYMGIKPRHTDYQTRLDPIHLPFYREQAAGFHFHKLSRKECTHYFYIIRPARHPIFNKRAVGGRFVADEQLRLTGMEELFVTYAMEEKKLQEISDDFFAAMLAGKSPTKQSHPKYVEWPDDRCRYDREKKEWRYDVPHP